MIEEKGIKKRIDELIKALGISSSKFSLTVSNSNSFARNTKDSIGSDKIRNILRAYPQVNLYWLIDGQGDMFLDRCSNNIMGNENNISGNNLIGNGSIDSSINVTTPEGYSKIIKPDRTIEIQSSELAELKNQLTLMRNKISDMQKTIDSQKETIEAQKLLIELLQAKA